MSNAVRVSVQTLRGNAGTDAAFAVVTKAVAEHNKHERLTGTKAHTAKLITALPDNTKGLAYQLATLATLARVHGATMIRLGIHNGHVALCGPASAIAATQAAMMPTVNAYVTAANTTYNPATHGNRVGYVNGFLCGCPAGLQVAAKVTATLAYGIGFLFPFQVTQNASAYAAGQSAGEAMAKAPKAPKAAKVAKAAASQPEASQPEASQPEASQPEAISA